MRKYFERKIKVDFNPDLSRLLDHIVGLDEALAKGGAA
jgi:hypothetical protein